MLQAVNERRRLNLPLSLCGSALMTVAIVLQNVTLASQKYATILFIALAITIAADTCLAIVARRGPGRWRIIAIILMLPTLFIVGDFLRRAPFAF